MIRKLLKYIKRNKEEKTSKEDTLKITKDILDFDYTVEVKDMTLTGYTKKYFIKLTGECTTKFRGNDISIPVEYYLYTRVSEREKDNIIRELYEGTGLTEKQLDGLKEEIEYRIQEYKKEIELKEYDKDKVVKQEYPLKREERIGKSVDISEQDELYNEKLSILGTYRIKEINKNDLTKEELDELKEKGRINTIIGYINTIDFMGYADTSDYILVVEYDVEIECGEYQTIKKDIAIDGIYINEYRRIERIKELGTDKEKRIEIENAILNEVKQVYLRELLEKPIKNKISDKEIENMRFQIKL